MFSKYLMLKQMDIQRVFNTCIDEYKNGNIEEALKNAFLKFDQSLTSEEAKKELNFFKSSVDIL